MDDREAGWQWFETPATTTGDDRAAEIEKNFARCFSGPEGAGVLAQLRAMTIERVLGPDAGDAALRHLEGQRHLVVQITAMIARGRNQLV